MIRYKYTFSFFEGAKIRRSFEVLAENPLDACRQAFTDTIVQDINDVQGTRMEMASHGRVEIP
jgi:hypothetical protein